MELLTLLSPLQPSVAAPTSSQKQAESEKSNPCSQHRKRMLIPLFLSLITCSDILKKNINFRYTELPDFFNGQPYLYLPRNSMAEQELKELGFICITAINSSCNRNISFYTSLFVYETSAKHLRTSDERCSVNEEHYLETVYSFHGNRISS